MKNQYFISDLDNPAALKQIRDGRELYARDIIDFLTRNLIAKTRIRPRTFYVFCAYYVYGQSYSEIADQYGYKSPECVRVIISRLMPYIRQFLFGPGGPPPIPTTGKPHQLTPPPLVLHIPGLNSFFPDYYRLIDLCYPNEFVRDDYTPTEWGDGQAPGGIDGLRRPVVGQCYSEDETIPNYRNRLLGYLEMVAAYEEYIGQSLDYIESGAPGDDNDGWEQKDFARSPSPYTGAGKIFASELAEGMADIEGEGGRQEKPDRCDPILSIDNFYRANIIKAFGDPFGRLLGRAIIGIAKKRINDWNPAYSDALEICWRAIIINFRKQRLKGLFPTVSYLAQAADYALRNWKKKQEAKKKFRRQLAQLAAARRPRANPRQRLDGHLENADRALIRFWRGREEIAYNPETLKTRKTP